MKTTKAFSTISYNSADFLVRKLGDLVERQVISFYAFVEHFPEEDEKKKHKHLLIIPNGQFQTDSLRDYLKELCPEEPLKPLGIMPCKSSKFGDWYLYNCHDVGYLTSKMQTRKYHYQLSDFVTSDSDYMLELIHEIDYSKYKKQQEIVDRLKKGDSVLSLIESGVVNIAQFGQWSSVNDMLQNFNVFRNGRETHTPKEDGNIPHQEKPFGSDVVQEFVDEDGVIHEIPFNDIP